MRTFKILSLLLGATSIMFAGFVPTVPEVDATTISGAIALVSGSVLVLRARAKK